MDAATAHKPHDRLGDLLAEDMAAVLGTIGYEVVCDLSPRVERRYA